MQASYVTQPANTETTDDDENWNLLAQASPERLSGVPRITHQDVPSNTRGERQHVLPEQAYLNMPFRSPVSPNHGPQEPKHHRSPVYSAQPILKKPSHESSVILSPGKSSGDAGSPARHIQGAGTACLRPFTRGQTVDHKNNEAEAESRYNQIQWQRLYQFYVVIPVDSRCCVGTAGPVTGRHVQHVLKCICKACMLLYASSNPNRPPTCHFIDCL